MSGGGGRGAAQRGAAEARARRRCALRRRDAPPERRESCSLACTGRTASRSARPGCSRAPAKQRARRATRPVNALRWQRPSLATAAIRGPARRERHAACRRRSKRGAARAGSAPQAALQAALGRNAAARGRTLLGSMVQNGKFSAGIVHLVSTLNSVLLPTLGMPQMPIFRCDEKRPKMGFSTTSSFFLGGILASLLSGSQTAERGKKERRERGAPSAQGHDQAHELRSHARRRFARRPARGCACRHRHRRRGSMAANLASLAALGAPTTGAQQGGAPAPAPARLPPKKRLRPDSASTATGPLRVGEGFLRATAEGEAAIAAACLALGTAACAAPAPRRAMRRSLARALCPHRASRGFAAPEYSAARALRTSPHVAGLGH